MLERQLTIVSMLFLDHKYGTYATQMTSQCVLSKPPLRSGRAPSAVGKSLFPAPYAAPQKVDTERWKTDGK